MAGTSKQRRTAGQRLRSRPEEVRLRLPHLFVLAISMALAPTARGIKLRFGERECVSQMVTEKSYVTGSFVALPLDGGLFGDKASYDLEVANPHGKLIYTTREKTEDKFSFKARYAGRYAFCLTLSAHNSLSVSLRSTHREVLWDVHVGHTWRHDRAQRHQMEPLWKSLEAVEQDLLDMQAVHRYLRDRETRNRLSVQRMGDKIMAYAVLRWVTLVSVSMFQIHFIRRLFDNSKHSHAGPNRL